MNDQLSLFKDRRIYSLFEVAEHIKEALQVALPDFYWIKAEIAKLNYYHQSGHCYVDLVDKQEKMIKAEMRATIWSSNYQMITTKFRQQTREDIRDGMTILFLASVNFHEVYGLSLNIIDIEPSFTMGEMAKEKRNTIKALKKEGVFDLNRKLILPLLPKNIAVISIETSKGFQDFVTTVRNNPFGYVVMYQLFPSVLQGEKAVETITGQLRNIARNHGHFDMVTILRGGGGEVGLSAYDNLDLAKEVACFPIPVITGIGHSTNETVVEMVAHTNLITPTAVASFLIQQFNIFEERINSLQNNVMTEACQILENALSQLTGYSQRFQSSTSRLLERYQSALLNNQERIRIFSRHCLVDQNHQLNSYEKKIELLDPKTILRRGYSITYLGKIPVKAASMVSKGQKINTQLYEGNINSIVE